MANIKEVSFTIKVMGEVSGEEYAGAFKTRPALPHALQLERDRLRREFLGNLPDGATKRAQNAAGIFSEMAVHLTSAPMWWTQSNNGLDLFDDNVVAAVYAEVVKAQNDFQAEIQKRAEAAKKDLEQIPTKE